MLQTFMHVLNAQRIVLASGSPRRRQILENVGLKFDVVPSTFEENVDKTKIPLPQDYVLETARLKVDEVATRLSAEKSLPDLLIGADTVVCQDSKIIEKPKDRQNARDILSSLSGRSHSVYTGVIIACPVTADVSLPKENGLLGGAFHFTSFVECTDVFMNDFTSQVIEAYIDTGEPMDKAGGYGIQAIGATLVRKVDGDYYNVMGFPLSKFSLELAKVYNQG